jgi:hypothetical protein
MSVRIIPLKVEQVEQDDAPYYVGSGRRGRGPGWCAQLVAQAIVAGPGTLLRQTFAEPVKRTSVATGLYAAARRADAKISVSMPDGVEVEEVVVRLRGSEREAS